MNTSHYDPVVIGWAIIILLAFTFLFDWVQKIQGGVEAWRENSENPTASRERKADGIETAKNRRRTERSGAEDTSTN